MSALKVLKLRNILDVGILFGRAYYGKHTAVTGEDNLTKLLERVYYALNEQQLEREVSSQVYAAKGRLEKKYQYTNKALDREDEEELKRDSRVWMELTAKSVSQRIAFEPNKPIILNSESLMQAATDYSNPFFDDTIWRALTEVVQNDFNESSRCFIAAAWTAAAMTALRGSEGVLRQYYEFKTQNRSGCKPWSEIMEELEKRSDVSRTLLGYLDFIRERRNETQHPEKKYEQRDSENIFTVVVNAVTAMCKEILESRKQP